MIYIYLHFEVDPQQKVWLFLPLSSTEAPTSEELSRAIRSLPRFLQLLLLLLCYDGLSSAEASELLDLSPDSVRTGLTYALDLLRNKTERWVDRDDVQNAFAFAIEHGSFPEEQVRRVCAKAEQTITELSDAVREDKI